MLRVLAPRFIHLMLFGACITFVPPLSAPLAYVLRHRERLLLCLMFFSTLSLPLSPPSLALSAPQAGVLQHWAAAKIAASVRVPDKTLFSTLVAQVGG